MATRLILHLGPGGAGTSSVAAATALRIAADGRPVLLLCIGPGDEHPQLQSIAPTLDAVRPRARETLPELTQALGAALGRRGLSAPSPGELTALPGADELAGLLELGRHLRTGSYAAIVVDAGPLDHALRTIALPALVQRWTHRADAGALSGSGALQRELIAVETALRDSDRCSARIVAREDRWSLAAACRARTALALHELHVDAFVLTPRAGGSAVPAPELLASELAPAALLRCADVAAGDGLELAEGLGASLFGDLDPATLLSPPQPAQVIVDGNHATLRLALPGARRDELALGHADGVLRLRVGGHERTLSLPPGLGDYRPAGASLEDGALLVTFDLQPISADA